VRSRATGRTYHLTIDPPPKPEDRTDPGPFERRDDDTEEALRRHLEEFHREIGSLKEHYESQGLLSIVDANRPVEEIAADILAALGNPERQEYYAVQ
jgi:adenylate kinase